MTTFYVVAFAVMLLSAFLCLHRIARGPTAPDRAIGLDTLGILIVGSCCLFTLVLKVEDFLTIAIAWALLSFIGTIALAKYLEGRPYDA